MSLEKSELRSAGMFEVGMRLDDMLEASKHEMHRAEGGVTASQRAMERVLQLTSSITQEIDNRVMSIDEAKLVRTYLAKVQAILKDLTRESDNTRLMAHGMMMGVERSVKIAKAMYDQEKLKGSTSVERGRAVGTSPKMSIKERRLAEAKAGDVEASESSNGSSVKPTRKKKEPKKRVTKKRAAAKVPEVPAPEVPEVPAPEVPEKIES